MLAAEPYHKGFSTPLDPCLTEIHRSTISLHHAKEGYDYPTIRLPHTFVKLAGLPTRIYQTLHDGMLAFLVVTGSTSECENDLADSKSLALTWWRSCVRITPGPSFFFETDTKIMTDDEQHGFVR